MTRRRWIADMWDEATATLSGTQAEHLSRVLRAQVGMKADVVTGGRVFHSEVASVAPDEIRFNLITELEAEPALPITLVVSVCKFDRLEWAIEKATELGVATIVPVIARRTEKHLALAAAKRVERWRRIVHESAKQARRSDIPLIHDPVTLAAFVKTPSTATRIVLAEQERTATLRALLEKALNSSAEEMPALEVAIGPEGGWASEEEALFDTNGWKAASLGPRILRVETAIVSAMAVIGSLLE